MRNVLVAVVDPERENEGTEDRMIFAGSHEWSHAMESSPEPDHGTHWQRHVKAWMCIERDVQSVVNQVSVWHPASEIRVFKLETVFYRQPGELKSKVVTKDGVVPF